ncbi:MAG: 4a-hydroxytetrahydrobiopterin dehydratase [Chitinophagaceae bacterium]|jgi:4a-hydroxytetrahydrobiopterin dehydratase
MWQTINEQLYKKFEFSNFVEAFAFITKIAIESERANHHPTITNTYNKVEIWLTTHDAGNKITQKDIELSSVIDKLR